MIRQDEEAKSKAGGATLENMSTAAESDASQGRQYPAKRARGSHAWKLCSAGKQRVTRQMSRGSPGGLAEQPAAISTDTAAVMARCNLGPAHRSGE